MSRISFLPEEDLYRLVIEQVKDYAFFTLDARGRVTSWSRGAEHILGYCEEEAVGQPSAFIFTPEDRAAGAPEEELGKAAANGRADDNRWHVRKDGERFWANGVVTVLWEEGGVRGFVKVMRDRTDQKRMEEALEESRRQRELERARLEAVLQQMPAGVAIAEAPSGRMVFHNEEAVRLLGHPMLEVQDYSGYTQYGALHPDGTPYPPEAYPIARALSGETVHQEEMVYRRGDGTLTHFLVNAAPIRGAHGEITASVSTFYDISHLKALEKALRRAQSDLEGRVEARTKELQESEERFSVAFHASPAPTYIVRVRDGCFLDVNESFLKLLGYGREEVVGRSTGALELFVDADKRELTLKHLRRGEASPLAELRLRTKSGEVCHVLAASRAITLEGALCSLGSFVDITERKRTEEDLMRALQAVMQDTAWLSRSVMEKLAQIKSKGGAEVAELTRRERQVLELIATGRQNDAIARELDLSAQTVRNYVATIYSKIGVGSRAEAVVWARERGLGGF